MLTFSVRVVNRTMGNKQHFITCCTASLPESCFWNTQPVSKNCTIRCSFSVMRGTVVDPCLAQSRVHGVLRTSPACSSVSPLVLVIVTVVHSLFQQRCAELDNTPIDWESNAYNNCIFVIIKAPRMRPPSIGFHIAFPVDMVDHCSSDKIRTQSLPR